MCMRAVFGHTSLFQFRISDLYDRGIDRENRRLEIFPFFVYCRISISGY